MSESKPSLKCAVKWIDCKGNETPDENDAIGFAELVATGQRFPICAEHAASLNNGRSHHDPKCSHMCGATSWKFVPFTYELRASGTGLAWMVNIASVEEAYSVLDGYAPRQLNLRVIRAIDGAEMPRVDYVNSKR